MTFAGTDGEIQTITVPIIDDTIIEATENLLINLSNLSTTLIGINDAQATINITDNDNAAAGDGVSFTNLTVSETEGNTAADNRELTFEVTYTGDIPVGETISIDFATNTGTADATDFTACLLYTSPSPRDQRGSRMPSSA